MDGITYAQQQRLLLIARVAYGSGITEGSNGGRGYMGVFDDVQHVSGGRYLTRVVKFLTHKGETCTMDGKPLSDEEWHKISQMTSSLRNELYSIARGVGDRDMLKRIRKLLHVNKRGESQQDAPPLLSRKIVAKVITEIADATQVAKASDDDFRGECFSWKMVEDVGRAKTVGDTSIPTLFDHLQNMWDDYSIKEDRRRLFDIATMVCGSGVREGSRGGRGYVALAEDVNGNALPIKFLTHRGETTDDLTPEQWKRLDKMTRDLRNFLLRCASDMVGDRTEKKVRALLKVDRLGEPTADAPRLLTRKLVAEVIAIILNADRGQDGLGSQAVSWKDIAARSKTEDDTRVETILPRTASFCEQMSLRIDRIRAKVEKMRDEELTERVVKRHIYDFDWIYFRTMRVAHTLDDSVKECSKDEMQKLEDELLSVVAEARKVYDRAVAESEKIKQSSGAKDIRKNEEVDENLPEEVEPEGEEGSILADNDNDDDDVWHGEWF